MSFNLTNVSDVTTLMAHTVILGGIIENMPKEKRESVREFALGQLNKRISAEQEKENPSKEIIAMLNDAKEKTINLFNS